MTDRGQRLAGARLYLVCGDVGDDRVQAALAGGVDIVQLRMKDARDDEILDAGCRFAALCAHHGALFILNDRPDLVAATGADGVHVGQDDTSVRSARAAVGPDRLVGLSTHTPGQIDMAVREPQIDYIGVGPVHVTPTKPGRPAVGTELIAYAAEHASIPFFAIGGIDPETVGAVRAAGAERIAVVRAITEAGDAQAAARALRAAIAHRTSPTTSSGAGVGAAS